MKDKKAGFAWQGIVLSILVKILTYVAGQATPFLREFIAGSLRNWRAIALGTDNEWDDALTYMLCVVMGVDPNVEPVAVGVMAPKNLTEERRKRLVSEAWRVYESAELDPDHPVFDSGGG
jgi:hypothetical protein